MFESILNRIEDAMDRTVTKVTGGVAVALPILVAIGFATAAAAVFVTERFGAVVGFLVIAAAFLLIAVLAAVVFFNRDEEQEPAPVVRETIAAKEVRNPLAKYIDTSNFSQTEREIFNAVGTAAPDAAKRAMQFAARNWYLIAGAGIGLIIANKVASSIERRYWRS